MADAGRDLWAAPPPPAPSPMPPPSPPPTARQSRSVPQATALRQWSTVVLSIAAVCVALSALMVAAIVAFVQDPASAAWATVDGDVLLLLAPVILVAVRAAVVLSVAALVLALVGRLLCGRGKPWTLVWAAWLASAAAPTCLQPPALVIQGLGPWLVPVASLVALGTFALATVVTVRVAQIPPDRHGRAPNGRNGPPMAGFHPGGPGTARDA